MIQKGLVTSVPGKILSINGDKSFGMDGENHSCQNTTCWNMISQRDELRTHLGNSVFIMQFTTICVYVYLQQQRIQTRTFTDYSKGNGMGYLGDR